MNTSEFIEKHNHTAPKNKFRLILVDLFDGTDWVEGDFNSLGEAKAEATKQLGDNELIAVYIYDENGKCLYDIRQ